MEEGILAFEALDSHSYGPAVRLFTSAIRTGPDDSILYALLLGRSSAYHDRGHYKKALDDAKQAMALNINDSECYYTLAKTHLALGQWTEVLKTCQIGHEIKPNVEFFWPFWLEATNKVVEAGISTDFVKPSGDTFQGKKMWEKLTHDRDVKGYLKEKDFNEMMKHVQINTFSLNEHMKDPRVVKAVSVLLNVNMRGFGKPVSEEGEAVEMKEENKDQAHDCGISVGADFGEKLEKTIKRASHIVKWAKSIEDFELFIDVLRGALIEISEEITDLQRTRYEQEHCNLELDEEHVKGNECFEQRLYGEALEHYAESLRRNPRNSKAHWSRAECYIRLRKYAKALVETEMYISLDPSNSDACALKGAILAFMEKKEEAFAAFHEGHKYDPTYMILRGAPKCFRPTMDDSQAEQ